MSDSEHDPTPSGMAAASSGLRIGVLDNDALALDCIRWMLEAQSRGERRRVHVWTTTSPAYAVQECLAPGPRTDALLIDMALNGMTGPQIAAEILARAPGVTIIGMTSYTLETYRRAAARSGIVALLDKATFGKGLLADIARMVDRAAAGMRGTATRPRRPRRRRGRLTAGARDPDDRPENHRLAPSRMPPPRHRRSR